MVVLGDGEQGLAARLIGEWAFEPDAARDRAAMPVSPDTAHLLAARQVSLVVRWPRAGRGTAQCG